MSKGDYIEIHTANGMFEVKARQNGRKVTLEKETKEIVAAEVTRGGTVVRQITFPRSEVIAIIEERRDNE